MKLSTQVRRTVLAGIVLCTTLVRSEASDEAMSEQEIIAFLEAQVPELFTLFLETKTANPEEYERLLSTLGDQITNYYQIRAKSPGQAQSLLLKSQWELKKKLFTKQIAGMQIGSDREVLINELRRILEEKFDSELRGSEEEVEQLENEIIGLRTIIEKQKLRRDDIIDRRLRSLIKGNEGTKPQQKTPGNRPPDD